MSFEEAKEFLPLLIPLVIAAVSLFLYALTHILRHQNYKMGNRKIWLIVTIVGMSFVGPVLYLLLGKEDE